MIFTAASEMIQAALERIAVHDPAESLSSESAVTCLRELNLLFDEYNLDRGKIFVRTEETFVLVVGTGSYNIGPTQTWNTTVPVSIEQAILRDTTLTPNYDRPLRVNMTQAEYNSLPYKSLSNVPSALLFSGGVSPATVKFDCAPDKAYSVLLYSVKPFTKVDAITDALSLPPGYEALLTAALGIRLCPLFQVPVPQVLVAIEQKMERQVDARNASPPPTWEDRSVPGTMNWSRGGRSVSGSRRGIL